MKLDKILETRLNASSGHIAKTSKLYFTAQVKAKKQCSHVQSVKMISSQGHSFHATLKHVLV